MEIIGSPRTFVQYRYVAKKAVIDKPRLIGLAAPEVFTTEFAFSKCEIPKNLEEESLKFRNGRIAIDGKKFSIQELTIGKLGLSSWVWAETGITTQVVDRSVEIIEEIQPESNISNLKKRINKKSEVKVRLDIDPQRVANEQLVSALKELSPKFKGTEFSRMEVHFPAWGFVFVSKPDIERMLANVSPTDIESEMKQAARVVRVTVSAETTEEYEEKTFTAHIETDLDTAKALLKQIEGILRARG